MSKQLENLINERESLISTSDNKSFIPILQGEQEEFTGQVIYPIICEGDAIGSVVILNKEAKIQMGDAEQKLANVAAGFLGRHMES